MIKTFTLSLLTSSFLLANTQLNNIKDNTIIIYDNLALISNKGQVDIDDNTSILKFPNISSNLITDSVSVSFKNANVSILEQNYKYDVVNFNSILNYYIDKDVSYNNKVVKLLSNNGQCVIQENNLSSSSIKSVNCNDIVVNELPKGMTTKPSLYWNLYSDKHYKDNEFNLSYLSNGFNWDANYVATINNDNIDLNGWIKLTNNSDSDLENYKLILLSGKVNRVNDYQAARVMQKNMMMEDMVLGSSLEREVEEKSFAGYHTYKIPFNVDIPKKSNKQISFFNKNIINYKEILKTNINIYNNNNNIKFNKNIVFSNNIESGLGIPLPEGKIRFYKKDDDGINYFIGENRIKNIPIKEELSINIGQDFDSTMTFKVLERIDEKYKQFFKYEYLLKNPSKEIKEYEITHATPVYNTKRKNIDIETTCNTNCEMIFDDVNTITYKITLQPETEYQFKSSFNQ